VFARHGPEDVVHVGLRELVAARAALDRLEAALVREGRRRGYTWADLGAALGLSLYGVRRRHLAIDPIYAWKRARPPTPQEEIAQLVAAGEGKMTP
jgi:hypothetical protein